MATATKKIVTAPQIDLGIFQPATQAEKDYKSVYYGLREVFNNSARGRLGESFSYRDSNAAFEQAFGAVEEHRYSEEELVAWSMIHFGHDKERLKEINKLNRDRYERYESRRPVVAEAEVVPAELDDVLY